MTFQTKCLKKERKQQSDCTDHMFRMTQVLLSSFWKYNQTLQYAVCLLVLRGTDLELSKRKRNSENFFLVLFSTETWNSTPEILSARDPLPFECSSSQLRTLKANPGSPSRVGNCWEKTSMQTQTATAANNHRAPSGGKQLQHPGGPQADRHSCSPSHHPRRLGHSSKEGSEDDSCIHGGV